MKTTNSIINVLKPKSEKDIKNSIKNTPIDKVREYLSYAIRNNNENIIKLILENKRMNMNHLDPSKWTYLMNAIIYNCSEDIILLLINLGSNVNFKNIYGSTPLSVANANKKMKIVKLLKKHGAKL